MVFVCPGIKNFLKNAALHNHSKWFSEQSPRIKNNYECAKLAVQLNPDMLEYVSDRLRRHPALVLAAVRKKGLTLKWAKILNNVICLCATNQNPNALMYCSDSFRKNSAFVVDIVKRKPATVYFAHEDLKNDALFVKSLVSLHEDVLWSVPHFADNYEIVIAAVRHHGRALLHASDRLRRDPLLVAIAVNNDGAAIHNAGYHQQTPKMFQLAVKRCESFVDTVVLPFGLERMSKNINGMVDACPISKSAASWEYEVRRFDEIHPKKNKRIRKALRRGLQQANWRLVLRQCCFLIFVIRAQRKLKARFWQPATGVGFRALAASTKFGKLGWKRRRLLESNDEAKRMKCA